MQWDILCSLIQSNQLIKTDLCGALCDPHDFFLVERAGIVPLSASSFRLFSDWSPENGTIHIASYWLFPRRQFLLAHKQICRGANANLVSGKCIFFYFFLQRQLDPST